MWHRCNLFFQVKIFSIKEKSFWKSKYYLSGLPVIDRFRGVLEVFRYLPDWGTVCIASKEVSGQFIIEMHVLLPFYEQRIWGDPSSSDPSKRVNFTTCGTLHCKGLQLNYSGTTMK